MLKTISLYGLGIVVIVCCGIICLSIGRYQVLLSEIIACFVGECEQTHKNVIFEFRLPRIVLAIVMGIGLSVSGAAFQSLFKNPLATPDILGVTSGASFGAVLALLFGLGILYVGLFGLIFGIVALLIVGLISYDKAMPYNTITMILSGIIVSALFQSLVSLIKYIADPQDTLPTITYWLLGSLDSSFTPQVYVGIIGVIVGSVVIFLLAWKINLLALDEDEAKTLGVRLGLLRVVVIIATTFIVACSVSLCGIIGWVGLLVPHIARLLVGSDNSKLIPLCVVIGAVFMMCVDTLSRSISTNQIPISILTALVGAPFFIYILHKNKGMRL